MFYGRGAGKLPTASAVVADVIDAAKHFHINKWVIWGEAQESLMNDPETASYRYFIRTKDASFVSKFPGAEEIGGADGEFVFVTALMQEKELKAVIGDNAYIRILP